MAAINEIIDLGIGPSSDIPHLTLMGLSPSTSAGATFHSPVFSSPVLQSLIVRAAVSLFAFVVVWLS